MRKSKYRITCKLGEDGEKRIRIDRHTGGLFGYWEYKHSIFGPFKDGDDSAITSAVEWLRCAILTEAKNAKWAAREPIYLDVSGHVVS